MKIRFDSKQRAVKQKAALRLDDIQIDGATVAEIDEFQRLVKRKTLLAVTVEQRSGTKKFIIKAHTVDYPNGIVMVTRRDRNKPRTFASLQRGLVNFKETTGINLLQFKVGTEATGGTMVIPFTRPRESLQLIRED